MKLFRISAFLLAAMLGGAAAQASDYHDVITTTDRVEYNGYICFQDPDAGIVSVQVSYYKLTLPQGDCYTNSKACIFSELSPAMQEAYAAYRQTTAEELVDEEVPLITVTYMAEDSEIILDNAILDDENSNNNTYVVFCTRVDIPMDKVCSIQHVAANSDPDKDIIDIFTLEGGEVVEGYVIIENTGSNYEVETLDGTMKTVDVEKVVRHKKRTANPRANIVDCAPIRDIILTTSGEYLHGYITTQENDKERMIIATVDNRFLPVKYEEIKTIRSYPADEEPNPSWLGRKASATPAPVVRQTEPEPDPDHDVEPQYEEPVSPSTTPAEETTTYTEVAVEPDLEDTPEPPATPKNKKAGKHNKGTQTTDDSKKIGAGFLEDIEAMEAERKAEEKANTAPAEPEPKQKAPAPVEDKPKTPAPKAESAPAPQTAPQSKGGLDYSKLTRVAVPPSGENISFRVCGVNIFATPYYELPGAIHLDGDCTCISDQGRVNDVYIDYPDTPENNAIKIYELHDTNALGQLYHNTFSTSDFETTPSNVGVGSRRGLPAGHKRVYYKKLKKGRTYAIYRPSDKLVMWFKL